MELRLMIFAVALFDHLPSDGLAGEKVALHAAAQRIVKIFFFEIQKLLVVRSHGGVDKDIDAAECIDDLLDHRFDFCALSANRWRAPERAGLVAALSQPPRRHRPA